MSVGDYLQEMENVVTKNAQPGEGMQRLSVNIPPGQTGGWEDLGGPTPQTSRPTDDSNKLNTPGATLKKVKDIVTKHAKEEVEYDEDEELLEGMEEDEEDDEEEDEDEGDENEKEKSSKKKMKKEDFGDDEDEEYEDEEDDEIEINVEEDVQALFGDYELSEEFKNRAKTIFEAVVKAKVQEAVDILTAKYQRALEEEVSVIREELAERVDSYLEYVSEEWLTENALQVESGIKGELSESFMAGLKNLFEEHYVEIPDDKYDVLENMVVKLDEMESRLNEQIERNVALNQRLSEAVSDTILHEVSEGLAYTQRDKLASLAEGVEFYSEEDYREKLETLRESYFPRNPVPQRSEEVLTEEVQPSVSTSMDAYLRAVSKYSAK